MKFRIILFTLFVLAPSQLFGVTVEFTRTLKVGMSGDDVKALQVALNRDPETRVAESGTGSQGNETNYFGPATKRAVIRFQEKYRAEVLTPLGLLRGTGFFGPKTRWKLLAISQKPTVDTTPAVGVTQVVPTNTKNTPPAVPPEVTESVKQEVAISSAELLPTIIPWTPDMVVPEGVNPNSINLEYYVAMARETAKKKGMSDQDIAAGERMIRERAATTTVDFRKEFFKAAKIKSLAPQSLSDGIWTKVKKFLADAGVIKVADAALGIHFGGHIYYTSPCTCTAGEVWQIGLMPPLPPSYATFLAYALGTQLYSWYTLPFSTAVLGVYSPPDLICWDYWAYTCAIRFYPPNWGVILPMTGSALL